MTGWPSDWKRRALTSAGADINTRSLAIMSAWRKSTPILPWTNNPIGFPAKLTKFASVPGTGYAAFPTISSFYLAFGTWARARDGKPVVAEISGGSGYANAWRMISNLKWPASVTETDYPSALLDLTEQSYRDSVSAADAANRRTSGTGRAPAAVHDAIRSQVRSLADAHRAFGESTAAVQHLLRKHG